MKTSHPSPFTLRHLPFVLLATVCLAAPTGRAQTNWGYALSFNGSNSYVSIGAAPLTSSWTAEFWVNRQDSPNTAAVLLDDGTTSLRLEQYYETKRVGFSKYGVADYTFNYSAPTNTWVHLAFVSDTSNTYLYVNGVAQDTISNTISLPLRQFGVVTNGAGASSSALKGTVDEIRIWNIVRGATDIQADLAQPLTNTPAGLVAYWKLDEGSGATAYDATTNHHNGTLVNGPAWVVSTVPLPFLYTTNNGTITITGCIGGGALTIPATINGLPVTSIGTNAFYGNSSLTSITIPDSITSIRDYAFQNCYDLTQVNFGNGVTNIGNYAFYYCISLTNVAIPNSVISIGNHAFYYCTGLTNVAIPNSVTSIGDYAFYICTHLTNVTIANGVTNIGNYAFFYCNRLPDITIPSTVTTIGSYAFATCYRLTSITIPDSVTSIGDYAFSSCGLTNVTIGNHINTIGNYEFYACHALTSVMIPDSVTGIGNYAFSGCGLTSVTIPNSVTGIGWDAFNQCQSLTNIVIGSGVTSIGDYAFSSCGLTSVTIPNSVTSIGWGVFSQCQLLTSITIPDGVTTIGWQMFYDCSSLVNITIPGSVTLIDDEAFSGCTNLTGIYYQGNGPSLGGAEVFGNPGSAATAYYLAGTTGWAVFDEYSGLSPAVLWNARAQIGDGKFGVRTNRFGFTITGSTNIPVVVDTCTNLASAAWTTLQTCTMTNGSVYFCDPLWTNYPARFYRIRWP